MTNDTLKSLGYLKKSLKMSRRAVEKNQKDDGTTDQNIADIHTLIDALVKSIDQFEDFALIQSVVPQGVVQPTTPTIPSTSSTSSTPVDDGSLLDPI